MGEGENAGDIGECVVGHGMQWVNVALRNAKPNLLITDEVHEEAWRGIKVVLGWVGAGDRIGVVEDGALEDNIVDGEDEGPNFVEGDVGKIVATQRDEAGVVGSIAREKRSGGIGIDHDSPPARDHEGPSSKPAENPAIKPTVFLHCAAGLHRTGFFGFGLLRSVGLSPSQAFEVIRISRVETATDCGAHRMMIAERMVQNLKKNGKLV